METFGNLYFYILLLIIILFLIGITITNSVYFSESYNQGSENLSSYQSQQLVILNVIACVLLFVSFIFICYMIFSKSIIDKDLDISNKLLIEHENKIDNKIHELDIIDKQKSKREKNKKSMVNTENNLKNKVSPLSDRSEEINSSLLGLKSSKVLSKSEPKKVKKIMDEFDLDKHVKKEVTDSKSRSNSLFNDGISELSDSSTNDDDMSDKSNENVNTSDKSNENVNTSDKSNENQQTDFQLFIPLNNKIINGKEKSTDNDKEKVMIDNGIVSGNSSKAKIPFFDDDSSYKSYSYQPFHSNVKSINF